MVGEAGHRDVHDAVGEIGEQLAVLLEVQRLVGAHEGLSGLDDHEAIDEGRHLLQVHAQEGEFVVEHHQVHDPARAPRCEARTGLIHNFAAHGPRQRSPDIGIAIEFLGQGREPVDGLRQAASPLERQRRPHPEALVGSRGQLRVGRRRGLPGQDIAGDLDGSGPFRIFDGDLRQIGPDLRGRADTKRQFGDRKSLGDGEVDGCGFGHHPEQQLRRPGFQAQRHVVVDQRLELAPGPETRARRMGRNQDLQPVTQGQA